MFKNKTRKKYLFLRNIDSMEDIQHVLSDPTKNLSLMSSYINYQGWEKKEIFERFLKNVECYLNYEWFFLIYSIWHVQIRIISFLS